MVCSRRFRISSRDRGGALDFLAFSNFDLTLDRGPITERVLFCIFPRISSIAKELFIFFSFNSSFKNPSIFWLGSSCLVGDVLYRLRREYFSLGCISQTVVLLRCKLRREVPFKLVFIRYNMESLGFLVFFLTLRARGMRRRWKQIWTRRSPPLFLIVGFWLLFFLCLGRERDWKEKDVFRFLVFRFLRNLPLFELESRWITLSSIFEPWEPLSSFSWSLLLHCTLCHSLPPICKAVKSWKRRREVSAPLSYCHDVGRIQHSIKTKILWNRICDGKRSR